MSVPPQELDVFCPYCGVALILEWEAPYERNLLECPECQNQFELLLQLFMLGKSLEGIPLTVQQTVPSASSEPATLPASASQSVPESTFSPSSVASSLQETPEPTQSKRPQRDDVNTPKSTPPPISYQANQESMFNFYRGNETGSAPPAPISGGTASPWLIYKLVFWGLQIGLPFGLFLLFGLTDMAIFGFLAILLLIPRLCLCRPLTNLVAPLFVQSVRCPGCQFEMEAVNRWTVGNYTDHKERHIFQARNPMDGTIVGHINCPQCDSTIRVR